MGLRGVATPWRKPRAPRRAGGVRRSAAGRNARNRALSVDRAASACRAAFDHDDVPSTIARETNPAFVKQPASSTRWPRVKVCAGNRGALDRTTRASPPRGNRCASRTAPTRWGAGSTSSPSRRARRRIAAWHCCSPTSPTNAARRGSASGSCRRWSWSGRASPRCFAAPPASSWPSVAWSCATSSERGLLHLFGHRTAGNRCRGVHETQDHGFRDCSRAWPRPVSLGSAARRPFSCIHPAVRGDRYSNGVPAPRGGARVRVLAHGVRRHRAWLPSRWDACSRVGACARRRGAGPARGLARTAQRSAPADSESDDPAKSEFLAVMP